MKSRIVQLAILLVLFLVGVACCNSGGTPTEETGVYVPPVP